MSYSVNSFYRRKNGTKEEERTLNAYLDTLQSKVYEVHRQLIESGAEISAENIKNKLAGVADRPKMIPDIFQSHNDQLILLNSWGGAATATFVRWNFLTQ
jgi:paraquat-inducible protein B